MLFNDFCQVLVDQRIIRGPGNLPGPREASQGRVFYKNHNVHYWRIGFAVSIVVFVRKAPTDPRLNAWLPHARHGTFDALLDASVV